MLRIWISAVQIKQSRLLNKGGIPILSQIEIMNILPHGQASLYIDYVLEVIPGEKAVAVKQTSKNELLYGLPIVVESIPIWYIIEGLAQTACIAGLLMEEHRGKYVLLTGIDNLNIHGNAVPGDKLIFKSETIVYGCFVRASTEALIDGKLIAKGEISYYIMEHQQESEYKTIY
jgi:3-hydroxyacyl-[acyl-carrier-protein] dehydratase